MAHFDSTPDQVAAQLSKLRQHGIAVRRVREHREHLADLAEREGNPRLAQQLRVR